MLGNILSTGEQVLILVVLLAVGFLCGKIRIFNDQSISHLSAFALKIVGPCAIVESFCRQFDSAMLRAMGIVALLAFAAHALYAAFAYVCIRGGKEPTRRVLRYGTVFANCGYMGLPLQQVLFGADGMILPALVNVWNIFLMRTYFSAISPSIYEAAKIDGANYFLIFFKLTLPLSTTALLTVGLMYALQYWNDWWHALMFINDQDLYPLQYFLYTILSNVTAISSGRVPPAAAAGLKLPLETVKMAVTVITIGPIIFLYSFIQKYFIKVIMTGAVKE